MASTDPSASEKIPDIYSIPQWFHERCCKDASANADIVTLLELQDPKVVPKIKGAEEKTISSTSDPSALNKSPSAPSSGRSSVVVVDAEQQLASTAQSETTEEDAPPPSQDDAAEPVDAATEAQSASQTTLTPDARGPPTTESTTEQSSERTIDPIEMPTHHKFSRSRYTSIKDTFAPALICKHELLAFEQPSAIALSVKTSEELPLADAIVRQLAKDFSARAILVDAEDVEDLAWDFDKQQKGFDKIEKDKKTAEKEKKKAEREKKLAENEARKAKREAKKAEKEEKEKKAAEEAAKAEATSKDGDEKKAAGTDSAESKDAVVKETSSETAESNAGFSKAPLLNTGAETAEKAEDGPSDTPSTQAAENITKTAEDVSSASNPHSENAECASNETIAIVSSESKSDSGKSESAPAADAKTITEENKTKDGSSADPETDTETTKTTEGSSTDTKTDEAAKTADTPSTGATSADKKDDDSADDDADVDVPEPEDDDESDNEVAVDMLTYLDPCLPVTVDSGYDLTQVYFGSKGTDDRSRKIWKRGRAALTSLFQNKKDDEPQAESRTENDMKEGPADSNIPASDKPKEADEITQVTNVSSSSPTESEVLTNPQPDDTVQDKQETPATAQDSVEAKQDIGKDTVKESDDKAKSNTPAVAPQPLLICIRDANRFLKNATGHNALGRFGDLITICREAGQRAILVVTLAEEQEPFKEKSCPCGYQYCCNTPKRLEKLMKRLRIEESAKIDLSGPGSKKKDDNEEKKDESEDKDEISRQYVNIRRLKRYLRHGVGESSAQQWFDASAVWDTSVADGSLAKLMDKKWDDTRVRRAVRQIIGRSIAAEAFEFEDVLHVIERLHEDVENDDDEKDKSEAAKAFEKKLEKVKQDCNQHEERLIESVVKPSALDSAYTDVIIDEDTKNAVKQLITLFKFKATTKSKKLLKLLNITGAMFYGPPGTGKTHLAKAMANDYGACMLALEASSLMDMWVGETEKLIKAAFTLATKLHPCILFIDEADSLFRRRTSCDKSWERNALTMYLQQMDGIGTDNKRPFVVVATNRPSDLDDAFLRRLPHKVHFNLPSEPHRAAILKLFLQDEDVDGSVDVNDLAKQTRGLSGSDLKSLCGQAVLAWATEQAIKEDSTDSGVITELKLTAAHFKTALKRTRPTVSRQALADVDTFARTYDSARF